MKTLNISKNWLRANCQLHNMIRTESEERVIEREKEVWGAECCSKNVFLVNIYYCQHLLDWVGERVESIDIVRQGISKHMKDLNPYKAHVILDM